jgi:hypothetical protein
VEEVIVAAGRIASVQTVHLGAPRDAVHRNVEWTVASADQPACAQRVHVLKAAPLDAAHPSAE